jgi:hypothetical protein
MLLTLTLCGLQSPAFLHSFTIPESSEPSLLRQDLPDQMTFHLRRIAALCLFGPPVDRAPATKQSPFAKTADVVALSPSIRLEKVMRKSPPLFRIPLQQPHFNARTF